jgi:hypothetical protein
MPVADKFDITGFKKQLYYCGNVTLAVSKNASFIVTTWLVHKKSNPIFVHCIVSILLTNFVFMSRQDAGNTFFAKLPNDKKQRANFL